MSNSASPEVPSWRAQGQLCLLSAWWWIRVTEGQGTRIFEMEDDRENWMMCDPCKLCSSPDSSRMAHQDKRDGLDVQNVREGRESLTQILRSFCELRSSALLRSKWWWFFFTEVSGQTICPIFRDQGSKKQFLQKFRDSLSAPSSGIKDPKSNFYGSVGTAYRPHLQGLRIQKAIFTEVWGQPIGPIFTDQGSKKQFLQKCGDSLSAPSSGIKDPKSNYRHSLRNDPEERSSRLLRGRSLK